MSTMAPDTTWMSIREAARRLGVHDNTMRRYVDRGLIRAVRLPSGVRRVKREDVESFGMSRDRGPDRTLEQLAREQGVGPIPSLDQLASPDLWRSDEELDEFLELTYAERDRDR
jgi:excisionase family DNA binding protein